MTRSPEVKLGPIPIDAERRWMARANAYEIRGEIVPFSVEVRLKSEPCAHDVEPADQDEYIVWQRADHCDCWPPAWPGADALPPGGLPVRLLRQLRLTDLVKLHQSAVANRGQHISSEHPVAGVQRHFERVADREGEAATRRGRPALDGDEHLRRLAVLDQAYASGQTQGRAARQLKISPSALRVSLEWARRQTPPLWSRSGRGRPGQLTNEGRALLQQPQPRKARRA